MADPLSCPRCSGILTDTEVVTLHRQYANSQRKTKSGGKNGGRRVVLVNPITKQPTAFEPKPGTPHIFEGHYQNVAAVPICDTPSEAPKPAKGNPAVHELTYSPLKD